MLNFSGNHSVEEAECTQVVFFSLIDILSLLIGHPVNAKLLWISVTSKKTLDILNFNLALFNDSQYFITLLHLIYMLSAAQNHQQIANFLLVYVQIGGPMSLSFICMERYVAVIHPTSYPLLKKYRIRELCALTVWLFALPSALVVVFAPDVFSQAHLSGALAILPASLMLVMGAVMVACSSRIARALKTSSPGRDKLHPVKRRAFRVVCATSAVAISCYLPVNALQGLRAWVPSTLECAITAACLLLLCIASFVHSVLYLSTHLKLLIYLKSLCNVKRS
uniref:C-X-C chemokine receptor type 2-like n=1 Tax=Gasterosteus aculeatus aculeatus TaxID=481459 RepID=UPI001A9828E9|nr:C-X-C chemokine receptor type 2-like [Gasterosteus aculeatus aculeatus]